MADDANELARLRSELEASRQREAALRQQQYQQAPGVHPAVTAGWQQADDTVKRIELEMQRVAQAANEAQSEGKFPEQIEYQRQLAALSNQKQAAEQHREGLVGRAGSIRLSNFLQQIKGSTAPKTSNGFGCIRGLRRTKGTGMHACRRTMKR